MIQRTTDASEHDFLPEANPVANAQALQRAVDRGGRVLVSRPGIYPVGQTVYVGSHTTLEFAKGVTLQKVATPKPFSHVLLNKGALTKTHDTDIVVRGLHLEVNGVDVRSDTIDGLRGQVAFFYVKGLHICDFRCVDLGSQQFAIHVCTFANLTVEDAVVRGDKDGVHLGRGRRFRIARCEFETHDDAIALNAQDYATSNPELGWIEEGVVEDCVDLAAPTGRRPVGYFCRLLAGRWGRWRSGMEVQQSDSVVHAGKLYRVVMQPDGRTHVSRQPPTHATGTEVFDGIAWKAVQDAAIESAGVRDVVFRRVTLQKPRVGFSLHLDSDRFSRSVYPGYPSPVQGPIVLDHVRVEHASEVSLMNVATPVESLRLNRCDLRAGGIKVASKPGVTGPIHGQFELNECMFHHVGLFNLLSPESEARRIHLVTGDSRWASDRFRVSRESLPQCMSIDSDLPGLRLAE